MARSHYRGTVYGNQPTGAKPLPGAAIRLFHPDTGQPWALPVYPDPVNGVPYSLPIYTTVDGELELWADEPARVSCHVTHRAYHGVGEVIEIRPDPETQATDEDVEESVEDHEAKADPHDQYLTQQEGDELYKPVGWEPDLTDYYTKGEADDEFLDQDEADLRYEQLSRKGMPNGYVPLDLSGYVPNQYLPPLAITQTFVVTSEAEMLALDAQTGDVCVRLDTIENFILAQDPASVLGNWTKLATSSVAGNTTVLRREEFTPSAGATSVTLALAPTTIHAVDRNGVGQSQQAGHYSLSGVVVTFTDTFAAGERVAVVYEIGSSTPAPINGYTKEESDLRYEPIDTMYTKSESDLRYLQQAAADTRYLQLIGGTLSGTLNAPALNIASKPVNVSPDSGNALVWRANGFYSSGSGGNVTVVNREEFFPAAAATTVTLAQAPSELLSVSRNGVDQFAGAGDYSLAGAVITFSDAFVAGERVSVLSEVGTSVPVDAYTTAQSEARYVNVTGDVMSGVLQVNANMGVGMAPSAWNSPLRAIQVGTAGTGSWYGGPTNMVLGYNFFADAAGPKAVQTGPSSRITLDGGLVVQTAPSVAAGAGLTWATRLTVDQVGNVGVNTALMPWGGNIRAIQMGSGGSLMWDSASISNTYWLCNAYHDGSAYKQVAPGAGSSKLHQSGTSLVFQSQIDQGGSGVPITFKDRFSVNVNGTLTLTPDAGQHGLIVAGPGTPTSGSFYIAPDYFHIGGSGPPSNFQIQRQASNNFRISLGGPYNVEFHAGGGLVMPAFDNNNSLGDSGHRWGAVYAVVGTIQTSSVKYKDPQGDLDPEQALAAVLRTPARRFRYKGTERLQSGYYLEEADPLFTIGPDEASPSNDAGILLGAIQALAARMGVTL